ncbi:MAG TPA: LytTR family DNA-binding domain-containing protein [Sporichthya sp.]|nr:LytTR family DNA-binding domain-containing protein [Sporichthya sp.]
MPRLGPGTSRTDRSRPLTVLAVDPEPPALARLLGLLRADQRVGAVMSADNGIDALRILRSHEVDGVFLDIRMPGLTGLEVVTELARYRPPPPVVFVTASEVHGPQAFELQAVDYVLKPARAERLAESVRRVAALAPSPEPAPEDDVPDETIPIELGGITRFISRRQVRYVESHGDYVRLHTADGAHLVRARMATLEARWADAGFIRIHRSHLVALAHITGVRLAARGASVVIGNEELALSRRAARELREVLMQRARADGNAHSVLPVR